MSYKILLAPKIELARPYHLKVEATVEAEYGEFVVEGTVITLAHHVKRFAHMNSPCNTEVNVSLPPNSTILISHLDLDTVGGIMAILGNKPNHPIFWEAAEYIDIRGPHHLKDKYPQLEDKFNAYWAWVCKQRKPQSKHEVTDVTELINDTMEALSHILNENDTSYIEEGKRWMFFTESKVENCLAYENDNFRVFITSDVSCSSAYFSKEKQRIIPYILTFNTKNKRIIFSSFDNGDTINAKDFVKNLWGDGAGGQPGIAGSPRGQKMQLHDLNEAVESLKRIIRKRKIRPKQIV